MKTPSMPVSRKRKSIMYGLTRSVTLKEARIASGVKKVVSRTMVSDRPSTPRCSVEPMAHTRCIVPQIGSRHASGWNRNHNTIDRANGTRLTTRANQRRKL